MRKKNEGRRKTSTYLSSSLLRALNWYNYCELGRRQEAEGIPINLGDLIRTYFSFFLLPSSFFLH
jgi:hypothetical protein